ncbi:MAG: helix-turn-helix transcriptional regulator [Rhodocyclaceae bacterium]
MDYPIKTLSQLKPILQAFRRSRGLTQAAVAERLGVTQQSYAQLEANPASASVDRLFKALSLLHVELRLADADAPADDAAVTSPAQAREAGAAYDAAPRAARAAAKSATAAATKASKAARRVAPKAVIDTPEDW